MRFPRSAWAAAMLALSLQLHAQAPGFRLGDAARPVSYDWHVTIDPREPAFTGQVRIEVEIARAIPTLWLNSTGLTIEAAEVRQDDRRVEAAAEAPDADHVGITPRGGAGFAPGRALVTLRYRGPIEPVSTRGLFRQQDGPHWYVMSQFEALSARRAVPCFDEPGFKTPWRIAIDAPEGNEAVANTPEVLVSDVLGRKGWKRHDFAATKPLPSYLVALGVGPFDIVDGGVAGIRRTPLRYVTPQGRGAEARYAREATPRLLEIAEQYFGRPYPFEKLDSMVIPQAVGFGAMENAGLITYSSNLMLATPREETPAFQRRYAATAMHEIAHMWFGDLVTLAWWDDIWLNEAFATWIEQKLTPLYRPEWDNGLGVSLARKRSIAADRLASARRIRNPVLVKTDIEGAFDAITYQKGAAVISMFEGWFGADVFRQGVRSFLARHEYGSATSDDFMRAIGESAGKGEVPLRMFRAFIDQPGVPLVDVSLQCRDSAATIDAAVARFKPVGSTAQDVRWNTPVCFRVAAQGKTVSQCTDLPNGVTRVPLAGGHCPDWVLANPDGRSHYVARYDAALAKKLRERMASFPAGGAVALVLDAGFLSESGLIAIDESLAWADAALGHPSPIVQLSAIEVLEKERDEWLTPALVSAKRAIVARRVLPLARDVGWAERRGESDETKALRTTLLPYAATQPEGMALRDEARRLALAWIESRDSLPAGVRRAALETAARFADGATYERLEAQVFEFTDARQRFELLSALGKVREPQLRDRALRLAIAYEGADARVRPRDTLDFLENALLDDANRRPALDFVHANFDVLAKKLPQDTMPALIRNAGRVCTREERDTFIATFKDRAARYPGGALRYRQSLETIDLCIAAHAPRA
jgi:cytosol alanyl aminopeptidase